MPIAWARPCSNFETHGQHLSAKSPLRIPTIEPGVMRSSSAMMIGLTILAVLTFIAIGEIRRAQGPQLKTED
jgi:hypothetical protein